jgi:hypothetical protein
LNLELTGFITVVASNMQMFFCRSLPLNLASNSSQSQQVPTPQPQSELDQMFSGLGLDNFTGGNGTNENPDTHRVNGNDNCNTSLSLEDKQRYVLFALQQFNRKRGAKMSQ